MADIQGPVSYPDTSLNYIGVPSAGLVFGQMIRTGTAGPSNSDDYEYQVFDQNGQPYPPHTEIPAGAFISIGYPAAPTATSSGQDVVTGSQIRLDEATIADMAARAKIAQDTLNEQIRQNDRIFEETVAQNQRQYEMDKLLFGEQQALRLFQERMQEAAAKRDEKRLAMEQENQRFQQLAQIQSQKLDIANTMASLRGPGDWVAWDNLVAGQAAPQAQGSNTLNLMDMVKDLDRQAGVIRADQRGSRRDGGMESPVGPPMQTVGPQAPGMTPGVSTPVWESPGGQTAASAGTGGLTSGITSAGLARAQTSAGGNGNWTPESPYRGQQQNLVNAYMQSGQSGMPIPGMERGGSTDGRALITGDSSKDRENPELVLNPTNAPLHVIPLKQMAADALMRRGMPAAESGGMWGGGQDISNGIIRANQYDPRDLANQPFINALRTGSEARVSGLGASLGNPRLGIFDMPSLISMRTWNSFDDSRRARTADLYERGLGADFAGIYDRSRRLAPFGQSTGASYYG